MKADDLRDMSPEQIEEHLEEARDEYFRLRFEFAVGSLQDTSKLRLARKEIARASTVLKEMERKQE